MFRWGCPNGGTIIICRSVQITIMMYLLGLVLRSLFNAAWPWHFDFGALWQNGAETVPWLGAIFAAVYVALYARFASQWSYLAGEYNQIRQTLATWKDPTKDNANHLNLWRAGFIEDALDLHLATKPMFGPYLLRMLDVNDDEMQYIREKFDHITHKGKERRERLHEQLKKRFPSTTPPSTPPETPPSGEAEVKA